MQVEQTDETVCRAVCFGKHGIISKKKGLMLNGIIQKALIEQGRRFTMGYRFVEEEGL